MYRKTLLLLVFVFSCLLSSCRATRQEIQKTETNSQETTEKSVTYKDTTLFAPKAETSLKVSLSELMLKNSMNVNSKPIVYSQKNAQANVKIKVVHDTIQVTATCDSLAIVAKIKSEFEKRIKDTNSSNTIKTNSKSGYTFFEVLLFFLLGLFVGYFLKKFKIV